MLTMSGLDLTSLRFDQPEWLWLSLFAIPFALLGWFTFVTLSTPRKILSILLRVLLILLLAATLAEPTRVKRTDDLAVVALIDTSDSIRSFSSLSALAQPLNTALTSSSPSDLSGLITFDAVPRLLRTPRSGTPDRPIPDSSPTSGHTNIAAAIDAALASIPPTAAARLLLISDGNQTEGDALSAARAASARRAISSPDLGPVPIDVIPLTYNISHEVAIEGVDVPPRAAAGDTINVRVTLSSVAQARGNLTIRIEGADTAPARSIDLPPGISIITIPVKLSERRVHRVWATFEPVPLADGTPSDTLLANNTGAAFTLSPGRGTTLIVNEGESALATALRSAGLPVESITPQALGQDPLDLQSADLVILDDVPADAVSKRQQEALISHVRDFGAGLVMTGGKSSFAAGGWRGSPLEPLLPIRLELPDSILQPELALVLVLDSSGSMNRFVMGSTRSQMDVATEAAAAAVRTLDQRDLLGVIEFNSRPRVVRALAANTTPAQTAKDIESISADGGTNLPPALNQAIEMLQASNAKSKHIIVLSDGRSMGVESLVPTSTAAAQNGIQISTISVGDDADIPTMEAMAREGRGKHYAVLNPSVLPRVFLRAIRIMRAPMVRETPFVPRLISAGSPLVAGLTFDVPLEGITLTRRRESPLIDTSLLSDQGEPLLAQWNVGLGSVTCFTSDTSTWSRNWIASGLYQRFWSQLVRTLTRAGTSSPLSITAAATSNGLQLTLKDSSSDAAQPLEATVTIYPPEGPPVDLALTPSTPGEYQAAYPTNMPGAFIAVARASRNGKAIPATISGAMRGRSAELATLASNQSLLSSIAQATGGRVLDLNAPLTWDLFNRRGITPREAWTGLWPWLVAVLTALTLLDIASRRIAWDRWGDATAAHSPTRIARLDGLRAAIAANGGERALTQDDAQDLRNRARDARRAERLNRFASVASNGSRSPQSDSPTPSPSGDPSPPQHPDAPSPSTPPATTKAPESPLQAAKRRAQARIDGTQANPPQ
jgi:Ca-activated chloride channel family protein